MTDETQTATSEVKPDGQTTPDIQPPKKRGRGRPPKDAPVSPDAKPVEAGSAPTSKPKPRKGKVNLNGTDRSLLAKQIQGLHQVAYVATGIPELQIEEAEAVMLSDALANVAEQYDLAIDGKTGALLQLMAACGMVYVPRFLHVQKRVAEAKKHAHEKGVIGVVGGTDHNASTP